MVIASPLGKATTARFWVGNWVRYQQEAAGRDLSKTSLRKCKGTSEQPDLEEIVPPFCNSLISQPDCGEQAGQPQVCIRARLRMSSGISLSH